MGLLQGLTALLSEFHPVTFFMDAIGSISEFLFGVNLVDAGKNVLRGLWDGMKGIWDDIVGWFKKKLDSFTSLLPDFIKEKMGLGGGNSAETRAESDGVTGSENDSAAPAQAYPKTARPVTGAASVMSKTGPGGLSGGKAPETKVKTEVVIKAENLPPGMEVTAPKQQADKTSINCGYAMQGH